MGFTNRLKMLIKFGATSAPRDDSGSVPVQQHEYMGKPSKCAIWRPYGFDANVPPGELSLLLAVLANPDAKVALQGFIGKGPSLQEGEVTVFHPQTGSKVHLLMDGSIEIVAGGSTILMQPNDGITITPASGMPVTVDGDLIVTGMLTWQSTATGLSLAVTTGVTIGTTLAVTGATTLSASVTSNGVNISDTHVHLAGTPPGDTGPAK